MSRFVTVASRDALPADEGYRVQLGERDIALFRVGDAVYAIDNECPHSGAHLDQGRLQGRVVTCPRHCWLFDVATGRCLTTPDYDVPTYPVRVEAGVVQIAIEEQDRR